jgi:hypothetical protein
MSWFVNVMICVQILVNNYVQNIDKRWIDNLTLQRWIDTCENSLVISKSLFQSVEKLKYKAQV